MAGGERQQTTGPRPRLATGPITPAQPGSTVEQTVALLHPSARRLTLPALAVIIVCALAGYGAGVVEELWERVTLLLVALTIIVVAGLFPLLFWRNNSYLITTRRIVARRGFFTRERRELAHSRNHRLQVQRRGMQRLDGSGDVTITTSSDEEFLLRDLPTVELVRRALLELLETSPAPAIHHSRQPEATRRPFDP